MCNVCCHECAGWCKAFTRTERLLTILECVLLVVFIGFLTFLILHLIVCPKNGPVLSFDKVTKQITYATTKNILERATDEVTTAEPRSTLGRNVKCTWKPSEKTRASTHHYEYGQPPIPPTQMIQFDVTQEITNVKSVTINQMKYEEWEGVENTDGEEADEGVAQLVAALVKIKPMGDVTFGCIATIVSEYWALTAASCIEAVEEVDSLDAFVLAGALGTRGVADVRLHPRFAADRRRDLAALRADAPLAAPPAPPLRLPTALDHLLLTVGERLTILGYGRFRSADGGSRDRRVHQVHVYSLPLDACARGGGEALRHLARPAALAAGACAREGEEGLCAGPLHARGLPCAYCAGTPLLARGTLLALMADAAQCGVACEPARYVSLAALRDWIDAVLASDQPL